MALDSWDLRPFIHPPIPTPLPSDHWYSEVFRALPDLVCRLLPGLAAAEPSPMDTETAYNFRAVALKKVAHHPDGVLWPRQHPGGNEALPVVILEVQICDVTWVDLDALARRADLDPLLALLTLPVQKEPALGSCAQRIVALRPDLIELIVPILSERFQGLSPSQLMATLGISKDFWRHTRAFQDILAEGRQEGVELGRQEGREEGRRREASVLASRLLERRCGSIDAPTSARIEALSLSQLEELALALLDFRSAQDLQTWLEPMKP